jgi:hypothetical protein
VVIPSHFVILIGLVIVSFYNGVNAKVLPPQAFIQSLEATLLAAYSTMFGLVFAASIFYMTFFEMRREHLVSRAGEKDEWFGEVTTVVIQRWKDIGNYFIRFWIIISATYAFIVFATFVAYLSVAFPGSAPNPILYYFVNYSMAPSVGDVILLVLFFFFTKPFGKHATMTSLSV